MVVTARPSAWAASTVHDFTDSPSSSTVHAPHDGGVAADVGAGEADDVAQVLHEQRAGLHRRWSSRAPLTAIATVTSSDSLGIGGIYRAQSIASGRSRGRVVEWRVQARHRQAEDRCTTACWRRRSPSRVTTATTFPPTWRVHSVPGPYPGVVVIHHMPGYDPPTKEIVRTFSTHGYVAICPNLHHRYAPGRRPADRSRRDARGGRRARRPVHRRRRRRDEVPAVAPLLERQGRRHRLLLGRPAVVHRGVQPAVRRRRRLLRRTRRRDARRAHASVSRCRRST